MNLLANALKFTARGGQVRVTVSEAGPQPELAVEGVRLTVEDTGLGIPPRAPGADLPQLLPGGRLEHPRARRRRPGAGHREGLRGSPRRSGAGGQHAGAGEPLHRGVAGAPPGDHHQHRPAHCEGGAGPLLGTVRSDVRPARSRRTGRRFRPPRPARASVPSARTRHQERSADGVPAAQFRPSGTGRSAPSGSSPSADAASPDG